MPSEVVLIDLSSIGHPIWHVTQSDPDPNKASQQIVARVRALASNNSQPVAICCDLGRSFRKDLDPTYKAQRPPAEAMLEHQIDLAKEQLAADGFPVWAVKGFEADDLIASAVLAIERIEPAVSVLIVSSDKDLLQLVGPRVRAMSARDGVVLDMDGVKAKFGVRPDQMRDYLTLVGDASDNVKGAHKIGPKTAAALLTKYESIKGIYEALGAHGTDFTPGLATSLREFEPRVAAVQALIDLRIDVELPIHELAEVRVPKEAAITHAAMDVEEDEQPGYPLPQAAPVSRDEPAQPEPLALIVSEPEPAPPADWERGLNPRSMKDARTLANDMHNSRLFSAYGTPQGVLSTVLLGRELGIPAMASLRQIHIIEGKHSLSVGLMVALILKSGMAEYFEPVEFDEKHAVFETKRKGARNPVRMEHTIEMAKTAGLVKPNSNWTKVPIDMLCARAQSRLARMVYPDIVGGLYTPDELGELREQVA